MGGGANGTHYICAGGLHTPSSRAKREIVVDDEPTFITRVAIENYKSIARCDVSLGSLTYLVGRNGAGKSNFLDALRFVADALRIGLDAAVRSRGSVDDLRYRDAEPGATIGLRFDLSLPAGTRGHYTLRLAQGQRGGFAIAEERCTVEYPAGGQPATGFHIRDGQLLEGLNGLRVVPTDRLYLATAPLPYERSVYDVLANMAFYQPVAAQMRIPRAHEAGELMLPDGSNVASVVLRLAEQQPEVLVRITEDLHAVLPTLQLVRAVRVGGYDALEFYQQRGDFDPLQFYRGSGAVTLERQFSAVVMSDGTLHALGVLVALFQGGFGAERRPAVIGIEEPETSLHPGAATVLGDAFMDVAELSQVLVTTQSAELLDNKEVRPESILAVEFAGGATRIGPLGAGQAAVIREHLATAGELLRTSGFRPALAVAGHHTS